MSYLTNKFAKFGIRNFDGSTKIIPRLFNNLGTRPQIAKIKKSTYSWPERLWLQFVGATGSERCDMSLTEETTNTKHTHKQSEAQ